jgi:tyrosinase
MDKCHSTTQCSRQQSFPNPRCWHDDVVRTFFNWIVLDYPETTFEAPPPPAPKLSEPRPGASRLRWNLNELCEEDIAKLKAAFETIMTRPANDPNSFFHVASFHGFPDPMECWHHFYGFLPWHRYHNIFVENALRSVPGCEDVTLPYWDQSSDEPILQWVWEKSIWEDHPMTRHT